MNNVIGHIKQKELFSKMILNKKIPHAFLFEGEDMIGKKTFALAFAKLVLGENSPDLYLAEDNLEISKIREIKNFLSYKSYHNTKKIVIIDNAHLMRKDAQNSLLKILEEPSKDSVLILITSFKDLILKTLLSRVQEINFYKAEKQALEDYLIKRNLNKEEIEEILFLSSLKQGKAIELVENSLKKEFYLKTIRYLEKIKEKDLEKRFDYIKEIYEDKEIVLESLNLFERFFRREMFLILYHKSKKYSLIEVKNIIEKIQETKYYFNNTNTNKKLLLENLMINI
ncbi:MAG: hypothetical protein WC157_01375 [Candidatus Paceibacterota bacterium]